MIPERDRIKTVMTAAEITAAMESGDYSAEMMLQHVIRHYNAERDLADRLAHWLSSLESEELVPPEWDVAITKALSAWKEARHE